mgnify:FL=1
MKRFYLLAVLLLLGCLTVVNAQSLDEMVEGSKPEDLELIKVDQEARSEKSRVSEKFAESVVPSPSGMLSFERLLNFVNKLIAELFGEDFEEEPVSVATGDDTDENGQTETPPSVDQPDRPDETKPLSGYEAIPIRAGAAGSGSEFMKRTENMTPAQRG